MMTSLGQQLKGEARLDYQPNGSGYTLDVPKGAIVSEAKSSADVTAALV